MSVNKTASESAQPDFGQALFDNLRRLASATLSEVEGEGSRNFRRLVAVSASETRVLNEANGSRKSLFM